MSAPRTDTRAGGWTAPSVYHLGILPPAPCMAWVQRLADDVISGAYEDPDSAIATESHLFAATNRAVPRHVDTEAAPGQLVFGWVLRNDGHVLRVEGVPFPLALPVGCLYVIDPLVHHWTEGSGQLIFSPHIMNPDARTPKKLLMDMRMDAIVAGINAERGL